MTEVRTNPRPARERQVGMSTIPTDTQQLLHALETLLYEIEPYRKQVPQDKPLETASQQGQAAEHVPTVRWIDGNEALIQLEVMRERLRGRDERPDYVVRLCEAVVAELAGYSERVSWRQYQEHS